MKKLLIALLTLLMLAQSTALAKITFTDNAYVGYVREEMKISLYYDGKNRGKTVEIRDENGLVLGSRELNSSKGYRNVSISMPASLTPGTQLSLYWQGENTPLDSALLAVETRPGYAITRVDRTDKKVAITFDAANGAAKTKKILDVLDKYGAKCTFFVIGLYAENHPELVREMEDRGHELAGHGWNHPEMPDLTNDEILKDFDKVSQAFVKTLGHDVNLYRPPSGHSTRRDRAIARALGQEVIQWTVDSRDGFEGVSYDTVVNRIKRNAASGDIVLMHVYGEHTIDALEEILPWYVQQGYECVTVSDLLLKGDTLIDENGVQHSK